MPLTQVSSRLIEDTLRYVLGASGTDHYTFTGKGLTGAVNDPTLTLSRGHTYVFENRNSSGAHPFYIKTSIANGGTNDAYNTGVTNNGGAGGTEIVFTVPHDAPDTLYYQCSSHSSMAGQLSISSSVADGSITTAKLADQAVALSKLPHGTSSNDGKFLRANNGADPTFETVNTDLVSDTSPQLGGNLASNGNDIKFADNDKAVFGTGEDLHIYQDGSHSYISEVGTGNLRITSDSAVHIRKHNNENIATFTANGAVELYHDNSKKIETTSYGSKTTGYHLQSAIPSFLAYGPNQFTEFPNADASYDMVLANTGYNTGTHYSTSTGRFTAPVAGLYFFHVCFYAEALSETHDDNQWFSIEFRKNNGSVNSNYTYFDQAGKGNNGDKAQTLQLTAIEPLAASDYFSFRAFNYFTTRWKWHGQYSRFMGYLIG